MKTITSRTLPAWLILATATGLSGCSLALSPLSQRSATFGNTASLAIENSSSAYQAVESATYKTQVSALVLDFDTKGFDRKKIKVFLPPADLEVRQTILRGLRNYADNLADTAGDKAFSSVDQQATGLSQSLRTLSTNGELRKLAPQASEAEARGLAAAVDTLGRVLIERKRRKALPGIIREMQPVLDQLCTLLINDLGGVSNGGRAGRGLRDQLRLQYEDLITNQETYIALNSQRLAPSEKAAEIAKLPQMASDEQAADRALAQTQNTLRDLVSAHQALLEPEATGTFRTRMNELIQDGHQVAAFYNSLDPK